MKKIRILPENITNKIAAGEVVQRPSSALKELIENAIDAEADAIEVFVEDGGRKLIQVIDNGTGMTREDLELAFERHSTSKIWDEEDLTHITTLGFRGEALASIASVARVEVKSRNAAQDVGHQLLIHGGEVQGVEPVGMNIGTHISVRDLFFNTPARKKFLKGKRTEFRNISECMRRFALGNPTLSFSLTHNGNDTFRYGPDSLRKRIGEVYGSGYKQKLIELDEEYRGISIFGYIGTLDLVRKSRGEQHFYLNGRYISDSLLSSAVYKGYQNLIQRGEYPFFVLNLEMDPEEFDVNVHPSKMEVKFRDQWHVFNYLRNIVERSFQDVIHTAGRFDKEFNGMDQTAPPASHQDDWTDTIRPEGVQQPTQMPTRPLTQQDFSLPGHGGESDPKSSYEERVDRYTSRQTDASADIAEQVWQVHKLYILSQIKSGLVVIDQHAAHERILFEEAMDAFENEKISSQQLLFPQVIELSPEDFDMMLELLPYLEQIGFELKEFGKNTVVLNATPSDMRGGDESRLIREIIDEYKERRDKDNPMHYRLAASYSCKAAIKAGDVLSDEEMRVLIHRLFQCEHPFHCPHGRPVIVNLTLNELHKRFERPVD